jgi:hypothetical protein
MGRTPSGSWGTARKVMATSVHTTAARPRKAGTVIVSRFSQAEQERARHLDRQADAELPHGRHAAADAAAIRAVRDVWPDAQPVVITHPTGGRA